MPAREPGDYLTLLIASNQAPTYTFGAGATSTTVLASAAARLHAVRIVPGGGATSVAVTSSVSAAVTWWVASWRNVDAAATVAAATNAIGNSSTSAVEVPAVALSWLATGRERVIRAASVNATATWASSGSTVYATASGNASMQVRSDPPAAVGDILAPAVTFDRGNAGTNRNESAIAFVLQPVQATVATLLTNGSFESFAGSGVATGWEVERTASRAPAYTRSSSTGVVDGTGAQRIQFGGQSGDSGMFAIYQSLIDADPGDALRASAWLSGTLSNAYAIFGIEGFLAGGTYINEQDTQITSLTATPTRYEVEYTCPSGTDFVAVYFQVPSVSPSVVIDVYLDKAILTRRR